MTVFGRKEVFAMALRKIQKVVVHDAIIESVLSYIRENRLAPGTRIPSERALSATLTVSRASVREALRTLESAGVLEIRHGGGAFFRSSASLEAYGAYCCTQDQLEILRRLKHLLEARRMIEEHAVAAAAPCLTDNQIEKLEEIERLQAEALESGASVEGSPFELPNMNIELAITSFLDNPVIMELHQRLEQPWKQAFRALGVLPFPPQERQERHRCLIEALRTRNAQAAVRAMAEHNRILEVFIGRRLAEHEGPEAPKGRGEVAGKGENC